MKAMADVLACKQRACFVGSALSSGERSLAERFTALPFEPYAPIRRQLFVWRVLKWARITARLEQPMSSGSSGESSGRLKVADIAR